MAFQSSQRFKILNTEPSRYSELCKANLRELGEVTEFECDRSELLRLVSDFDIVIAVLRNTFDAEVLSLANRLRYIATPTTGLNHIDLDCAEKNNVKVISLKGEIDFLKTVSATAELTWGLLLALIRHIPSACLSVQRGYWNRNEFLGVELKGKTLGILGCGRLGEKVAHYGLAFDMNVVACDPYQKTVPNNVRRVSLEELFLQSDIVSIHLPLNNETVEMVNKQVLSRLRKGSLLINTSRGEIVDERALIEEMKSGRIAGFACDVLVNEFSNDTNWLLKNEIFQYAKNHPNVLITPHLGGVTSESFEATNRFIIEKLKTQLLLDRELNAK